MSDTPRRILVSGGTSGIGRAWAERLASRGRRVWTLGSREPGLRAVREALPLAGTSRRRRRCGRRGRRGGGRTRWSRHPHDGPSTRAGLLARIPAGRFGRLDEVAALVDFHLASDAAYMTGGVITMDGAASA